MGEPAGVETLGGSTTRAFSIESESVRVEGGGDTGTTCKVSPTLELDGSTGLY
jgi:hypothetical protein